MKKVLIAIATCGALALGACASIAPAITSGYNVVCVGTASQPSVQATLAAATALTPPNAAQSALLAELDGDCLRGAPTNILTATIDFVSLYGKVKATFPKAKLPAL